MGDRFSQLKAALALSRASLLATFRSPTSVVFSLLFPVIFILVFGSMVDPSAVRINVGISRQTDTANMLYRAAKQIPILDLHTGVDSLQMIEDLKKGRISAIVSISPTPSAIPGIPGYLVKLETSSSTSERLPILVATFGELVSNYNHRALPARAEPALLQTRVLPGRIYRQIDFVLPGQLGFSLLMAGVFGSSFLLFHLRQSHVLKRISAAPVGRGWIIAGEMLSRFYFQLFSFIVIVALGYFAFHFTLVYGWDTFWEMLLVSVPGLVIFMGIGFIISGLVRSENAIAPVANTVTLPQILLCGLFFPVESYPHWLQGFCKMLPLTFYVDSLRKIAFEGLHVWQIPVQLAGLAFWTVAVSWLAVRFFEWE